jgi:hypothetical protein
MRPNLLARPIVLAILVVAGGLAGGAFCNNSYEANASSVVNDGTNRLEEVAKAAEPDLQSCALGEFAACDRSMDALGLMADEVERTYTELSALEPSDDARQWHADYLQMLRRAMWAMRSGVAAWEAGDYEAVLEASAAFQELVEEEERLVTYFNERLR